MLSIIVMIAITAGACFTSVTAQAGKVSWDFKDGGATEGNFTAAPVKGQTSQVLGQVRIVPAAAVSAELDFFGVTLAGSRAGLSNFKVYTSTDATFDGGDPQFSITVAADPGATQIGF